MAKENKNRDDINSNDTLNIDTATGSTASQENPGRNIDFIGDCAILLHTQIRP